MPGSDFDWKPKRTIEECDHIITAPGQIHELELTIIDGQVQKVYKNLPAVCADSLLPSTNLLTFLNRV